MSTLQELKQEADELGVSYAKNVSANKLQEKIEAFYESQETSGPALEAVVAQEEAKPEAKKASGPDPLTEKINKARAAAEETRIVTIIDNDQRVNNQTTTCTVNCSNAYFDLGTIILPLNEKIEVRMGHLKTLEQVQIPLHMRDNKTGLSTVKMRPRYTISYEDNR
jgi:hypothetical protein